MDQFNVKMHDLETRTETDLIAKIWGEKNNVQKKKKKKKKKRLT